MPIDWDIASRVVPPFVTLVGGALLNRWSERKPKLVYFLSYADAIKVKSFPEPPEMTINSHSVVVRNVGRKTATGVRIGHAMLPPDFSIHPSVKFKREVLPEGGVDIVVERLRPSEQITISYLYLPPLTPRDIVGEVKHDDGMAVVVDMIPMQKPPDWLKWSSGLLMFVGAVTLVYLLVLFVRTLFP